MARVFVGLSGGVDSAVSAALLKESGHDVVGCFIRIWRPEFLECTWREDRLDAMRVAAHLRIPFKEIDLSDTYAESVIAEMLASYRAGETPNPDVTCNRAIKFAAFLSWARDNGAETIATGHYARREGTTLLRALDPQKDQSYFLARVEPSALTYTMFPIGGMRKMQVREEARRRSLPVAQRPDSQGLCFVGDITLPEFLGRFLPASKGQVISCSGETLGEHDGAHHFTIGQRHGLRVASDAPFYVVGIDIHANTVTVSHDAADARVSTARLRDIVRYRELDSRTEYEAVTRYHAAAVKAYVSDDVVTFSAPVLAVPGQVCALYDGDTLVGSGIIAVENR